ncbi:MAG: ATP-binding protein [Gammaproteobacteria bacterium]
MQILLSLLNDILDFSKVDAGRMDLEALDFDLRLLLGELAETMALRAQEKGLELILDVTGVEPAMVRGDPGRVRQVFTNLVGNAIKFTTAGEVLIRARLETRAGGLLLRGGVTDTGIGIAGTHTRTVPALHTGGDASTTRRYGGTGLGLAISKKICELMEGRYPCHQQTRQRQLFASPCCCSGRVGAGIGRRGSV